MPRVLLSILLTVFCFSMIGCTEDPPADLFGPDESKLPVKATSVDLWITLPVPTGLNPALVPPIFNVRWVAKGAYEVRWILVSTSAHNDSWDEALNYIRNNPDAPEWSEWQRYAPRSAGAGMSWWSPPVDFGDYVFAVAGRNPMETTDIEFNKNASRLRVGTRSNGPIFEVFNRYIGTILTATTQTPPTIITLPSGIPMSFTLRASAEAYGGIVVGYRYGWDILDLNDDDQWEIEFTPFVGDFAEVPQRIFFFGSHTFNAEVIDNTGFKSRVTVVVNVIPAIMDRPLLVVDDWVEGPNAGFVPTRGRVPSDAEHDAFWLDMVNAVDGFSPANDVFEIQGGQPPPLDLLLQYQNIIWNTSGQYNTTSPNALHKLIRYLDPNIPTPGGTITPDYIALYMAAGGHVMLCGKQLMTMAINRVSFTAHQPVYPIIFRYELGGDQDGFYEDSEVGVRGVGEQSFAYSEGCLNVLDIASIAVPNAIRRPPGQQLPPGSGCPVDLIRDHGQNIGTGQRDGLRATLPIDVSFPRLELRPEVAGDPTLFFHESNTGLNNELYNPSYFSDMTACADVAETDPPRDCFEPIYGHECFNTASVIYGAPVAYWTSVFENRVPDNNGVAARSTIWGFHPVYFNPSEMAEAMEIVLFDEWQLLRTPVAQGATLNR